MSYKTKYTPEERRNFRKNQAKELKESIENFLNEIIQAIKQIQNHEDFIKVVELINRIGLISELSYNNQILCYIHYSPLGVNPTYVKTYKQWQEVGRQVQKGSKAVKLLRPTFREVEDKDGEEKLLSGFAVYSAFDISATEIIEDFEGEVFNPETIKETINEIPSMPEIDTLVIEETDNSEEIKNKMLELVKNMGKEVREIETNTGLYGYVKGSEPNTLYISSTENPNNATFTHTLIHELSHSILHMKKYQATKLNELEAELIASIVSDKIGLKTQPQAIRYLTMKDQYNDEDYEGSATRIIRTCMLILKEYLTL